MYVFMMVMNYLANALPLNGISTGAVSFKYPNLFQPSGLTFSIWGLIYALLLAYLIFQFVQFSNIQQLDTKHLYIKINIIFGLTSLINGLWLLAWHYDQMIGSTLLMLVLLALLIYLAKIATSATPLTRTTFSVYLGWVTVATIANITITLVKLGVPSFNSLAITLTVITLIVGVLIAYLWITKEKDYVFGFVLIWAYLGIFIRHMNKENLNQSYPILYYTTLLSILVLTTISLMTLLKS